MHWRSVFARTALGVGVLGAVVLGPGVGCGESKGGLMLAVTTDMLAPKDVNVVSVSVQVGPEIRYNFVGRVTPEGEVLLPATLAIVEPDDPSKTIRVRVIAFKETKARVLRDIITTSPRNGRIALLRMPLSFVNDESATGELPADNLPPKSGGGVGTQSLRPLAEPFNPYGAEVVSKCPDPEQTVIDGECASAHVDSATLPEYSDALVFPGGDRVGGGCFSPRSCFAGWREAVVDLDQCTAPKNGDVTNVTLVTAGTGECNESGQCFVPIDRSDAEGGWRDEGDLVRLPRGVCKKLREGATLGFVGGAACAQKTPAMPVCTGGNSAPIASDGGAGDADAAAEDPRVVEANGVSGVAVFADRLYYANADGVFRVQGDRGAGALVDGSPPPGLEPWFVAQHGDNAVFARGSEITGTQNLAFYALSGRTNLTPIEFAFSVGAHVVGAGIGPTHAWFPLSDGSGSGDVGSANFTDPTPVITSALYSPLPATAVHGGVADHLWVGRPSGEIDLCVPLGGAGYVRCDYVTDTVSGDPVVGIAAASDGTEQRAFLLKPDGIQRVTFDAVSSELTAERLTTEQLTAVDDGGNVFTRGIAMRGRCAFYATPRGLAFVNDDASASGLLAETQQGLEVIGVAAPVIDRAPFVWYAARGAAINGGGVYRVSVPAACL